MIRQPRIVLIHATPVAVDPIREAFARLWPEAETVNILDDSLSADRAQAEGLEARFFRRFDTLADYAVSIGADGILFTCSAFGPAIEAVARRLDIPALKPNEAMYEEALARGTRIGMVTTFPPSAETMQTEFDEDAARLRPGATLAVRIVAEAMTALRAGDAARHNALVAEQAQQLARVDALMLAQFSTARAAEACRAATPCPVLTSPEAAVRKIRRLVEMARN